MSSIVETPLAEENLGLVHLCANRFRNRGIEYDDLYGAGCIGILIAAKAFDSDRQVIASLEAEDRKLIYLRYFQNKTQMETAKQLGMSQVQVSRREKKLLTLMREQLK